MVPESYSTDERQLELSDGMGPVERVSSPLRNLCNAASLLATELARSYAGRKCYGSGEVGYIQAAHGHPFCGHLTSMTASRFDRTCFCKFSPCTGACPSRYYFSFHRRVLIPPTARDYASDF